MGQTVIELSGVRKEFVTAKKYPGFKGAIKGLFTHETEKKVAVDDVSFSIKEGEIVGYIGSNGAGKSTTIKMMSGILTPTKGQCLVNGIEPYRNRLENAKNIGVVFGQRTQLWWDLPLSETYTVLKEVYEIDEQDFKVRMKYFNEVLGFEEFMNSTVRTLSLGQRMRADLAAALLHNPKVLYLDEPTIGLDIVVKDKIRRFIKEINGKYNTTVILTTHDLSDIEELCNRIIIIDAGKKIYDGTLTELKESLGQKCRIRFELKEKLKPDWTDMLYAVGSKMEIDLQEKVLTVSFSKKECSVAEIISEIMKIAKVKDVQIKEAELADIVKGLYKNGLEAVK